MQGSRILYGKLVTTVKNRLSLGMKFFAEEEQIWHQGSKLDIFRCGL